jgi:hypothetical protein
MNEQPAFALGVRPERGHGNGDAFVEESVMDSSPFNSLDTPLQNFVTMGPK